MLSRFLDTYSNFRYYEIFSTSNYKKDLQFECELLHEFINKNIFNDGIETKTRENKQFYKCKRDKNKIKTNTFFILFAHIKKTDAILKLPAYEKLK